MPKLKRLLVESVWIVVALGIIAGGFFGFQVLGQMRDVVEAAPVERVVPIVDTVALVPFNEPLPVRGEGFIRPQQSVVVATQVAGRIVALHDAITNRGSFTEGDVLVRLDDRAQRAALAQTEASIASAQANLELVETQLERSQQLRSNGIVSQDRVDQLLSQQTQLSANLTGLRASLASAQVQLENTVVTALFDGKVLSKDSDLGAVVNPGQAIASIYSSGALEVLVPVSENQAAVITGLFGAQKPSATIRSTFAGKQFEWDGQVARVESSLDSQTRTLRVAVRIQNPDGGRIIGDTPALAAGVPPALINAFVTVVIDGGSYANLYAVPSAAVRGGNAVWLADNGVLDIHPARLIHVDGATSYIEMTDLPGDVALITSPLASPRAGADIRVAGEPANVASVEPVQ